MLRKKGRSLGRIPEQEKLFRPILEVGIQYPAGSQTKTWYNECKTFFPNLTERDFRKVTGKNKENAWRLQIRYAKKKLEYNYKYMKANLPRGFWCISNAGARALKEMQAGTWVPPKSRKDVRQ